MGAVSGRDLERVASVLVAVSVRIVRKCRKEEDTC